MQNTAKLATVRFNSAETLRPARIAGTRRVCTRRMGFSPRLAGTVALWALLLASLSVAALSFAIRAEEPAPASWVDVAVDPNSTVWDIAAAHPVQGLSTADTVDLIYAENDLSSGVLQVGQTLRVPAAPSSAAVLAQR